MSHKTNLTDYSHFSLFRSHNVESLLSVAQFQAKHVLLTPLLCEGIGLILIICHYCPNLNYAGISDMETILCGIYLTLSEVLYDHFGVKDILIKELILSAWCIVSTRDLCHADIELIRILMLIMLDFNNVSSLHRCGLLIFFKGNISTDQPHHLNQV